LKLKSLDDLLVSHLQVLYRSEKDLAKSLPKMVKAASSSEVRSSLKNRASQSKTQRKRLQKAVELLGHKTDGGKSTAMKAVLHEGIALVGNKGNPAVMDAGLIGVLQAAEHYRMAAYGSARAWANEAGHADTADLLQQTLDENKENDQSLSRLAELVLSPRADGESSPAKKAAAKASAAAKVARATIASKTEKVKRVAKDDGAGDSAPSESPAAAGEAPALDSEVSGDPLSPVAPSP
jgi:ferritin-like metal-binding protein YciE